MEEHTIYIFSLNEPIAQLKIQLNNGTSVTLDNSGGAGGNHAVHPNGKYLYLAFSPTIWVLSLDSETGALTKIGNGITQVPVANGITVHPKGNFLYTINLSDQSIYVYSISSTDGTLNYSSQLATGGGDIRYMVIDPSGRFAYVADNGGLLKQYSINPSTGELTSLGSISFFGFQWNLYFL